MAFKLLSHSRHRYDVCSSLSNQWGYDARLDLTAGNIRPLPVKTDDVDEWVDIAIEKFEEEHAREPYDCIMTRSMPPESIKVGMAIKEKHPELPWIASLGDPISRVPHMMRDLLRKNKSLDRTEKQAFTRALNAPHRCDSWLGKGDKGIDVLCEYKNMEADAINNADMLICPNATMATFVLCGMRRKNVVIIPHSFDKALYPEEVRKCDERKEIVFVGSANDDRSLKPFVLALHRLQETDPDALAKLKVRFIGNIDDGSRDLVYNFFLNDTVTIEPGVDYLTSLSIMRNADLLLHVDAYYKEFSETGGSLYLAGKIADYIGAGTPILALTGDYSPAHYAVEKVGGVAVKQSATSRIAYLLSCFADGRFPGDNHGEEFGNTFSAEYQGARLDASIEHMLADDGILCSSDLPKVASEEKKLLTVCVPAYNVQQTLDRALRSIVSCRNAGKVEVLVVNDGSPDRSREVALRYQERYPGIVTLVDKENGGHGSTINRAIELGTGTYFRVLDGDDWFDPAVTDRYLDALDALDKAVDLVVSDYCRIDIKSGKVFPLRKKSAKIAYDRVYKIKDIDIGKDYFALGNITYRLQLLRECGLKLSEHSFYVDVQYQLMPLPEVKTIMFTSGLLYHYAVGSDDQSVSVQSFVARYENHTRVIRSVIEYYYDHESAMSKQIRAYYRAMLVDELLRTQYTIGLVYDSNRKRGFGRIEEFDAQLKAQHPDLYKAVGETYPAVALVRRHAYAPGAVPAFKSIRFQEPTGTQKFARKIARKAMRGGVGDVVSAEIAKKQKGKK